MAHDQIRIVQAGGEGLFPPEFQSEFEFGTWLADNILCERCEQFHVERLGLCQQCLDEQEWVMDEMRTAQQQEDD